VPITPAIAAIDLALLETLGAPWVHLVLGMLAMLTQELGAILGGFAAEQGHMPFATVVTVVAAGVFVESVALYGVGRWRAAWVRLKLRKSPPIVKRVLNAMRWNPWRSTIIARFVFGGRIALPLACGAAHVPPWIFFTGTAVASVLWGTIFAGLGWGFGEAAVLVIGEVRRYEGPATIFLIVAGVATYWWLRRRSR
jgi:membrane protein DedA with SNARE-associated domain